jgi:Ca2+-binding RTX toxin-like protein
VMGLGKTGAPSGGCHGGSPDTILSDNESLEGSNGNDVMYGDSGNNTLFGHVGADSFYGEGGSDLIEAIDDEKDKVIDCGPGKDLTPSLDAVDPKPKSC